MIEKNTNETSNTKIDKIYDEKQRLRDIDERITRARDPGKQQASLASKIKAPPSNTLSLAFRVSVELISALVVGTAIGWLLDYWFDTRPWFLIIFVIMGGGAGVTNVYRMAKELGYGDNYHGKHGKH
tara:strand:- start:294 stop:674 length:381 start_codon:yes stop_codon:yes gene_type:complete